ncbi:transcriptional regulator, LysR family [Aliiroseovarius halocynthiae]|uniref:LysR family transcriptional regulator n=1 Tax=Aliiroseovarius halocynthiae TaxID=985055 RepID=A0A545SU23_9RHOB|nr:LysR family transcriptional regulator [Aliiroseovarius halocynthiae]TQV68469.1 LysR family transcriptional regulator [Aliiroseovarius halocynthiae]SMR70866.1 transcriptional regulator, LysR family [Aliiroseovarius halocynthiae]
MNKSKLQHSLTEYNALRAVMLAGTTVGAARQLGISQSAVSRSITNLESKLGQTLFEREAGRLSPTSAAVRLNRRLDPLFEALRRIDGPTEPVQENLRLIAPPSYSHRFLVSSVSSFLKMHPDFHVSFEVNTSDEVTRGVLEDRFDLGVIGVEIKRSQLQLTPYRKSSAVCVMPLDHPLASRSEIHPEDLHGQDMIALSFRHERRGQLERLLHQVRAEPNVVAEVSTSFAAADLAKDNVGLAVINPFPLFHYRAHDIAFVPFRSPIQYQSYFVTSSTRPVPRTARIFMRHLRLHTPNDPFSQKA